MIRNYFKVKRLIRIWCLTFLSNMACAEPLAILGGQGPASYASLFEEDGSLVKLVLRFPVSPSGSQ